MSAEVGAGTGYTTGPDATARVLVKDDDAGVDFSLPVGTFAVPLDWDLNPPGLVVDDSFRLLIVTSTRRTQFAGDIAAYDTYVRNNVRNTGHTAIREYGAGFRVVGCTSSVDADDHTATTYSVADPGVPIYWLDGDRVAGDFRDFYDGAWDSNAPRYPDGTTVATSGEYGHVLTGCTGSGQRLIDHTLGSELPEFGVPGQNGRELESTHTDSSKARSFYGLSPLFRITGVPFVNMVAISSTAPGGDDVYETGDAIRVTVTFNEAVTVDTLGGTPELALTIGERTRNAAYSAGDSSATALVFTYTVVAQDSDEDGVSVAGSALMLIGSAIHRQGDAAVAAATALRALPGQAMHRVTTPPMLQSAAVDGASLVLTYDEDLDEGSVPPRDAFTVSVAGAARALAANDPVDVSGKTVTLTLATAAEHGQTVTVTYTVPTGTDPKPIRDVAQNNAAALAGQAVTNETPDIAGPVPTGVAVGTRGASIVIRFDEALDETEANLPAPGRFRIRAADGARFTVGSVAVSDLAVTLTLASGTAVVRAGQTVTLAYTDLNADDNDPRGVVQDGDGNDAADFTTGENGVAAVVNLSTIAPAEPDAPTGLEAEGAGSDRIRLRWDAPADTGGRAITGYRIEVSEDVSPLDWTELVEDHREMADSRIVTEYVHSDLDPGDRRHYRVAARNAPGAAGLGSFSVVADATAIPPGAPDAPTGLTATAGLPTPRDGTTQIVLAWMKPANEGDSSITGYRIEWSADGTSDWQALAANHDTMAGSEIVTEYSDTGLGSETTRHYRVFATNGQGTGLASNVADTTTAANEAPVFTAGLVTTLSIAENSASRTNVGSPFTATDADTADTLTYTLEGTDAGSFSITDTGQIQTNAHIDHEARTSHSVTVKVSDGTDSATLAVTIDVADEDDTGGTAP